MRIQADLVDQLFNSSEKRLARILLLMAEFGTRRTRPAARIGPWGTRARRDSTFPRSPRRRWRR